MGPGTWTRKLHEMAIAVETGQVRAADIDLRVDGPYGNAPCGPDGADGAAPPYDAVVLVAGGIGVTPLASLWQAARAHKGDEHTRWTFVWTVGVIKCLRWVGDLCVTVTVLEISLAARA